MTRVIATEQPGSIVDDRIIEGASCELFFVFMVDPDIVCSRRSRAHDHHCFFVQAGQSFLALGREIESVLIG